MTDSVANLAITPDVTPDAGSLDGASVSDRPEARNRILLVVVMVATIVPFFWAAIRDARNGFYPTLDVASTVVRARATFSAHPPLLGMWSSGSSWAGHEIHFPAPTLLWFLAGPTHLFGNTWGPLLAMALLNAFWVSLAIYLVYRRVGVNAALITALFFNLFIWSIGSENLIDARPMEMVTIPFLCFLFLTWLVASGEIDALPGFALVANFLFLNHLVLAIQVPVISMCAGTGIVLWIRRTRREQRNVAGGDTAVSPFKRLRRRSLQALAITFILWLPALIQQITTSPGNLNLLLSASRQHRLPVGSYVVGYNTTIRLIARPSFWFRGRFSQPSFRHDLGHLGPWDIASGVVLLTIFIGLGIAAWRRRDRLALGALAVAVVGITISIETVTQAPSAWGFPLSYLRSLWGLAAFVWFAVAFSAYRRINGIVRTRLASFAAIGAVVFGMSALSYANYGSAIDMVHSPLAQTMVDKVVPQLKGRGPIYVTGGSDFTSQRYYAALLLGLDAAGVPYCVGHGTSQQYGSEHDCASKAKVRVDVQAPKKPKHSNATLLAYVPLLTSQEHQELIKVRAATVKWLSGRHKIELTPAVQQLMAESDPALRRAIEADFNPPDGNLVPLLSSGYFRTAVGFELELRRNPGSHTFLFADKSAPVTDMARYFELTDPREYGAIWVYEMPVR